MGITRTFRSCTWPAVIAAAACNSGSIDDRGGEDSLRDGSSTGSGMEDGSRGTGGSSGAQGTPASGGSSTRGGSGGVMAGGSGPGGSGGVGGSGAATSDAGMSGGAGGFPTNDGGGGAAAEGAADAPSPPGVTISGRRLVVEGEPYVMRGICWNPVPRGATHPSGLDYAGFADEDGALMQAAGLNTVRTYAAIVDPSVLDSLWSRGIRVLNTVYGYGGDEPAVVTDPVNATKDHPAILGWVLGNEWNYNGLYTGLSHADALARINEAAALVRAADPDHPIITVYGELPSTETIDAMPDIDLWGINAYRGLSFGDLFTTWAGRSEKPMFLAEYGADAYNANLPGYDPDSQEEAVRALTEELLDHASGLHDDGVTVGGTLFEWADEWWKDGSGGLDEHDVGGVAPGGGPYPDQTFNEEWWGVVEIDRTPRPAYDALAEVYAGTP